MRRYVLSIIGVFILLSVNLANKKITLFECYDKAYQSSPVLKEKQYHTEIFEIKRKIISSNWYPSFDLNGQVTYQSEAIEIDMSGIQNLADMLAGNSGQASVDLAFPSAPKDQYKLTMDIKQTIYDGGVTKKSKVLEEKVQLINHQQVETELYRIKDQVNQVYFSILILNKNNGLLELVKDNIQSKVKVLESGVKNGTVLESGLDVLKAELLNIKQQQKELEISKVVALGILNELINDSLAAESEFMLPDVLVFDTISNKRPENILFDYQKEKIDATTNLMKSSRLPKMYAFSQVGYGKPGLNMLNDELDSYYILGAGLNWNIFDWNKNKNERQTLEIQKNIIESKKENFNKNLEIASLNNLGEIKKLEKLIETDIEIISLRERITSSSSSQLDNGVINSSQYLIELNAEKQAKINLEIHKIRLIQAKVNYLNLYGSL